MLAGRTRRLCDRQDVRKQVLDSWADSAVDKTLNDSLFVQKHAKKMQRRSHTFRFRLGRCGWIAWVLVRIELPVEVMVQNSDSSSSNEMGST